MVEPGRRHVLAGILVPVLSVLERASTARAQGGHKVERLIVPLSVGSAVDIVARILSEPFGTALDATVVVDNQPGAGSVTGTTQIVRAPKDGSTVGMVSSNHVINPSIYKSIPFDSLADITPISVVCTSGLVLVVHPSVPVKTAAELVAYARAQPDGLFYGSAGNGSVLHLAAEMFRSLSGAPLKQVPYRGTGPLMNDLVGGQVPMAFVAIAAAAPHVSSGKLRAIGVSTAARSPLIGDVPTLAEQGIQGFDFEAWIALIGPAGLPAEMVARLYKAVKTALATPRVQEGLRQQGFVSVGSTPEEAAPFFASELAKHARLAREAGLRLE